MNRSDLQRLAAVRLREAKALFKAGEYSGAYYLAGYAIECGLKACIAKGTQRSDFPDKERATKSFVHNPTELIKAAGLFGPLQLAMRTNPALEASWGTITAWSEKSRYQAWSRTDAEAMIDAVSRRGNGVLPWIKLHW